MRVSPIAHQDWSQEVREILAMFSKQLSELGLGGDETEKDSLSPVLSCLLRNPNLARAFLPFGRYLLMESSLSDRYRELIILRTTWLWHCEYEWSHHSNAAIESGLITRSELNMLQLDKLPDSWSEDEHLLIQTVNELRSHSTIERHTWESLNRHFSIQELLDVVFIVGGYVLSGFYINVVGIPLKEGMQDFPD